jgi:hypothetical protein
MIHPPHSSELEKLYPDMIYSDIYLDYPIGEVTRYWTKLLISNGVRLEKLDVDENGMDDNLYRPHHKTFPWSVHILHMYSPTIPDLYRKDCYKINFNLESRDVTVSQGQGYDVVVMNKKNISVRYKGTLGYSLSDKERNFIDGFFKGDWCEYVDMQGSRVIVQFWLEDYYPIFRKEKILTIQNKLLSL